jgi:hypothetical protein
MRTWFTANAAIIPKLSYLPNLHHPCMPLFYGSAKALFLASLNENASLL